MAIRGFCGIILLLIAGCDGPNAPGEVADGQSAISEPSANSSIETNKTVEFQDLLQQLQEATDDRRFERAVKLAEAALELQPENLEVLEKATKLSQSAAVNLVINPDVERKVANVFFFKAASFARRLGTLQDELGGGVPSSILTTALYNEACAYATNGNSEMALASLKEAFEIGPDDLAELEKDADFDSLRDLPEFAKIVNKVIETRRKRSFKIAREDLDRYETFDFDFNLVSVDGDKVALADFKGKVLIVDFWGTWCPPCQKEIPHFVKLHREYKDAGLEIVGINYKERGDDPNKTIRAFAKKEGILYPCMIGDNTTRNRVPNFEGYPTTLFVDKQGKVRLTTVGYHSYDRLEAIVRVLLDEGNSDG